MPRKVNSSLQTLFNSSNLNGRANLIWEHGEFIVSREYYGNKVNLYALPSFYAETYYSPDQLRIFRIEPITDFQGLSKFLPNIDLKLD